MQLVEFVDVSQHPVDPNDLVGFFLDHPQPGTRSEAAAVDLWGWVLGRHTPAVAVEIVHDDRVIRRTPVNIRRPDVSAVYPGSPGAETSGFRTTVRMLGVADTKVDVRAVLKDQSRVLLASLHARGYWREDDVDVPLVSVIIPCYNQARYLSEAIESAIAQTYPHLEIVVIDDGSTDNAYEVASRYPGVRVIRQPNSGLGAARNTGIRRSNGDFLIFLDADDRLLPNCVTAGLDAFRSHPDSAFVFGRFRFINQGGQVTYRDLGHAVYHEHYSEMLRRNYIPMLATVMFRRGVFETVGGFRTSPGSAADYDLYLRTTRVLSVSCHEVEITEYRRHGTNMSSDAPKVLRAALKSLRAQAKFAIRDQRLRMAYRDGVRFWTTLISEEAVRELRILFDDGERARAFRTVASLCIAHPKMLMAMVRASMSLR